MIFAFSFIISFFGTFVNVIGNPMTKIMPLGDSITQGSKIPGGYRKKLYDNLEALGYKVDFLGTKKTNRFPGYDPDHEGNGGFSVRMIAEKIESTLDSIDDPDVVLLLLGTNDFQQKDDIENAINRWDDLILHISTLRPYAHIIASNLLVRNEPFNTRIQNLFNPFVEERINAHAEAGRRVSFVDLRSHVQFDEDLKIDNLHPNQSGYNKIADAWVPAIQAVINPDGDMLPPGILRIKGHLNRMQVTVTFSKPIGDDSIENLDNFVIENGIEIIGIELDSEKRNVLLNTSVQMSPGIEYTVKLNGIVDRTVDKLALPPNTIATFSFQIQQGYTHNIPPKEWNGYELVYSLDIPANATYGNSSPAYNVDNHLSTQSFSRIAYYMELKRYGGELQYVWVSMNAFTTDAGKIGVPTYQIEKMFQEKVTNLNIFSNVKTVSTGNGLDGNIEFWPNGYGRENSFDIPDASDTIFDFGDSPSLSGYYGSMQVHRSDPGETIFAFNKWGKPNWANSIVEIGIGDNPNSAHKDWTLENNGDQFEVKTLEVLVLPLSSKEPTNAPTSKPSNKSTLSPTATQSSEPSLSPSDSPTEKFTNVPSSMSSNKSTPSPTMTPSIEPRLLPSTTPTENLVNEPSSIPSNEPTHSPTMTPSIEPRLLPSTTPTGNLVNEPSSIPSHEPTHSPTMTPSIEPSHSPSTTSTEKVTNEPSSIPSNKPTNPPTMTPSIEPSHSPSTTSTEVTNEPSSIPSNEPTHSTTIKPSIGPSHSPSAISIERLTNEPSSIPSNEPTHSTTIIPSIELSHSPSAISIEKLTNEPSSIPSNEPTHSTTFRPSSWPSHSPSTIPMVKLTNEPSSKRSNKLTTPSNIPSLLPSNIFSGEVTNVPSTTTDQHINTPTTMPTHELTYLQRMPTEKPTHSVTSISSRQPTMNPSIEQKSFAPQTFEPPTISETNFNTLTPSAKKIPDSIIRDGNQFDKDTSSTKMVVLASIVAVANSLSCWYLMY